MMESFPGSDSSSSSSRSIQTLENKIEEACTCLESLSISQITRCRELAEFITACAQGIKALQEMDSGLK